MTVSLITKNVNNAIINNITIEPLYQDSVGSIKQFKLIAGNEALTGVEVTPYKLLDVDEKIAESSEDSYTYFTLSTNNVDFFSSLTLNFSALEEKTIYLKTTIPEEAVVGTFNCGLKSVYDTGGSETPIPGFEDWDYYDKITVTGGTLEFTNWFIEVDLTYIEGLMSSYFVDVRFALSDGTELDYDVIESTAGVNAKFKVEVPTVAASPGSVDVYVLFGNPEIYSFDETTLGDNPERYYIPTLVYEDQFDEETIDERWTISAGNGDILLFEENLKIYIADTADAESYANQPRIYADIPEDDYQVTVKINEFVYTPYTTNRIYTALSVFLDSSNFYRIGIGLDTGGLLLWTEDYNGVYIDDAITAYHPIWLRIRYEAGIYYFEYSYDGSAFTTFKTVESLGFTPSYVGLMGRNWYSQNQLLVYYDNFKVEDMNLIVQPATGTLGSATLNGHELNIEMDVWGRIYAAGEDGVSLQVGGSTIGGMTDFSIKERATDKCKSFDVAYSSGIDLLFASGDQVTLNYGSEGTAGKVLEGHIDESLHSLFPAKKTYKLTGKDRASVLRDIHYRRDGSVVNTGTTAGLIATNGRGILEDILSDTEFIVGSIVDIGDMEFANQVSESTLSSGDWFCGYFKTLKAAIDYICVQARKRTNKNYQWFIDAYGVLNIFSAEDLESQSYIEINDDHPKLEGVDFKDSINSIINSQTGFYGEKEVSSITIVDIESIGMYGLHEGDDLHDSSMNQSQMEAELHKTVDRLCFPIYTLSFKLRGFVDIQVGQPLYTNIEPADGVLFVVSDFELSGGAADDKIVINATTDRQVLSETEAVEVIMSISKWVVDENSAIVGTVNSVTDNGIVGVSAWGTGALYVGRDINHGT